MPFEEPDKFAVLSLPLAGIATLAWVAWRTDDLATIMILGLPSIEYLMHLVDGVAPQDLVSPRLKIVRLFVGYVFALMIMADQPQSDQPFWSEHAAIAWFALVVVSLFPMLLANFIK
jgi:hypothetical protein